MSRKQHAAQHHTQPAMHLHGIPSAAASRILSEAFAVTVPDMLAALRANRSRMEAEPAVDALAMQRESDGFLPDSFFGYEPGLCPCNSDPMAGGPCAECVAKMERAS